MTDNKGNKQVNNFIEKVEGLSDSMVKTVYSETLVEKVENLGFMKSLINSSFIKSIQNFGEGWFKKVFVFFGWLGLILMPISMIIGIYSYTKYFSIYPAFAITGIIFFIITLIISVPYCLGMVKFKKWFPFMVILFLVIEVLNPILISGYGIFGSLNIVSIFINIVLNILVFIVFFALVIKNKELFKN